MTSLSSSFQSCLPLGGLVNQRVQRFCSSCLTLKLSGSSKTVTILAWLLLPLVAPLVVSSMAPSGETGIVSRGTGSLAWFEATSVIVALRAGWSG